MRIPNSPTHGGKFSAGEESELPRGMAEWKRQAGHYGALLEFSTARKAGEGREGCGEGSQVELR